MRRNVSIIIAVIAILILTSCGYNNTMYEYLSSDDNYKTYSVTLFDVYYYDRSADEYNRDFSSEEFLNNDVTFKVSFDDNSDISGFLGYSPAEDKSVSEYMVFLKVTEANNKLLSENNFYNDVILNETIEIRASDWIYMDGNFFYIAEVNYQEKEYLNFDDGLNNIITMIKSNKSIF